MPNRKLTADEAATLILITSVLFGSWFRIMPAWIAGFPINDGGMFYTMIRDLQANHYLPPLYTTYNQLNIPFVYPPLGFYLGALLTDLLNLPSPLGILRWVPGILNSLCIPAFYFLAKEILSSRQQAALSTLVYALIPFMSMWNSMGGGLTRAAGACFTILALTNIYRVFSAGSTKDIWGAIIFSSLVTLSHTEAPIYCIAIAVYMWAMKSRTRQGLLHGSLIALGVLVLSAPWYGWMLYRHGFAPLVSASQTGFHSIWSILRLINIDFVTGESWLDLLGVLGILGIGLLVSQRKYFIPGMLLVIYLAEPRSAHTIGDIPLALAAGFFVGTVLLPAITNAADSAQPRDSLARGGLTAFLFVLIPYLLGNSIYFGLRLSTMHVSSGEQEAMHWATENTPPNARFLVITGEPNGFCDATSEWFPTLTGRQSAATLQGNEWLKGEAFSKFVGEVRDLQMCAATGLECLRAESARIETSFDFIYVSSGTPTYDCNVADLRDANVGLIAEMERSPDFREIYRADAAAIFAKRSPPD